MLNAFAFGVLSLLIISAAIAMIMTKNILHEAYWFLAVALLTAAIIWFLGAEYVAIVQLLVYCGSVGVLMVFTLMVTYRSKNELIEPNKFSIAAFLGALGLAALLIYTVLFSPSMTRTQEINYPTIREVGIAMFSMEGWVLPFEVVSLVLTVALIAAVWWTRAARPKDVHTREITTRKSHRDAIRATQDEPLGVWAVEPEDDE
jgi:NADH-quinone oxidoreductase subunit J